MKCSRCGLWIEGDQIRFADEGDWMGKPLCRKCKIAVEEESRDKYRKGRGKEHPEKSLYDTHIYDHN